MIGWSVSDVLEELVGDIRDEIRHREGPFFERSKDAVSSTPTCRCATLANETGWPLSTQTTETVEKMAPPSLGHVPHPGDKPRLEGSFQLIASRHPAPHRRLRVIRTPLPQLARVTPRSRKTAHEIS